MADKTTVVIATVKAFLASFPDGQKDIQEAFSAACDVSFSLLMTIAATAQMDEGVVLADFMSAIERRARALKAGTLREWKANG